MEFPPEPQSCLHPLRHELPSGKHGDLHGLRGVRVPFVQSEAWPEVPGRSGGIGEGSARETLEKQMSNSKPQVIRAYGIHLLLQNLFCSVQAWSQLTTNHTRPTLSMSSQAELLPTSAKKIFRVHWHEEK